MGNIAIIFDMDGVLMDSEPAINQSIMQVLQGMGVPMAEADLYPYVGTGEDYCLSSLMERYRPDLTYDVTVKDKVYDAYLELAPGLVKPFDGVRDLLLHLHKQGVAFAVGSSADRVKVEANLNTLDLDRTIFGAIVTGSDVARKKPAPDVFLEAARRLGADPADCVVIEDATNGIRAAKTAGMQAVGVLTSYKREEMEAAGADHLCPLPSDLMELLGATYDI